LSLTFLEPAIYRAIIDDVITNIKNDFDDYGVGEDILSDLQSVSIDILWWVVSYRWRLTSDCAALGE
jgi:hypothetical protein